MTHTLQIEAKLNTKDVEQKLNSLQSKSNSVASNASGVDQVSDAIKQLKSAIVASGVLRSLDELGKSFGTLGSRAQEQISKLLSSGQRIVTAAAAGGPIAGVFVGALEALGATFRKLNEQSEKFNQRLQEQLKLRQMYQQGQQNRQQRRQTLSEQLDEYGQDRRQRRILEGGNWGVQVNELDRLKKLRKELYETAKAGTSDETDYSGSNAAEEGIEALAEVKKLDGFIKQLEDALKASGDAFDRERKAREEEQKRIEEEAKKTAADLEKARQSWGLSRELQEAEGNRNVQWIQHQLGLARERMGAAKNEGEYNEAASWLSRFENSLKNIDKANQADKDKATADAQKEQDLRTRALQERFQFLTGLGSPVSDFSAAGFSMGEVDGITRNIENQIDQIIRLMQEQISRNIQFVNQPLSI